MVATDTRITRPIVVADAADMGREDWLAWRRQGVGASDVAAILGLSPWASPFSVWADKVGLLGDEEASEVMEAGQWLELAIAPWFEDRTGLHVSAKQMAVEHASNRLARCTLDGLVHEGRQDAHDPVFLFDTALGGLEIKTTRPGKAWAEVPAHYQAQAQWQMYVCGLERVHFAVLAGRRLDTDLILERDQDDIDFMVEAVDRFWSTYVVTGEQPPTDGSDATARALAEMYPEQTPGKGVALDEHVGHLAAWTANKAAKRDHEKAEKAEAAAIKALLGDAEEGTVAGKRVVSWRQQSRTDRCPCGCGYESKTEFRVLRDHAPKEKP